MSNKIPYLSDRKRDIISEEELNYFYDTLKEFYEQIPFDLSKVKSEEQYYNIMRRAFTLMNLIKGTIVLNQANVPQEEGLIYVSNHIGSFDQFYISKALKDRPLHYLVKDKVTTWPIRWNLIYKPAGSIVVDQTSIKSWNEAKKQLVSLLINGHNVFIFPEGTRRGENNLGEFHSGIAQVAQDSQKSIVTLAIKNSAKLLSSAKPIVAVGETIHVDKRSKVRILTQQVKDAVLKNYNDILDYEKVLKRR